jgi:hypothetical protein
MNTRGDNPMTEKPEYEPSVLMAACIQAAAQVLIAKKAADMDDPETIARLAAQIRDEALLQM